MTSRALLVTLRNWLLPVALGCGAFAVHYAMHVPPGPLPPPSPAKQDEERKAADKAKREEERKQREADRKAGKSRPRTGPRELPYEPFTAPRRQFLLDQLWAYYEPQDLKHEPTFDAWQTAHKPLISQIVTAARTAAGASATAVTVGTSECHTIRCRFSLVGADSDELTRVVDLLRSLELEDGPLWHSFEAGKPAPEKKGDAAGRQKLQVTVSFARDLPAMAAIRIPGKGPLRPSVTPGAAPPGDRPLRERTPTPTPRDAPVKSG
jgi:hypothetical protein